MRRRKPRRNGSSREKKSAVAAAEFDWAGVASGLSAKIRKERFDYPIFLYEAEKVGITATGDPDANELYTNDRMPTRMKPEETCLEYYPRFCKKPATLKYALDGASRRSNVMVLHDMIRYRN